MDTDRFYAAHLLLKTGLFDRNDFDIEVERLVNREVEAALEKHREKAFYVIQGLVEKVFE